MIHHRVTWDGLGPVRIDHPHTCIQQPRCGVFNAIDRLRIEGWNGLGLYDAVLVMDDVELPVARLRRIKAVRFSRPVEQPVDEELEWAKSVLRRAEAIDATSRET